MALAITHIENNDLDAASASIERAVESDPEYGQAYHVRGDIRHRKGETEKAEEDFAKAKKLGYMSTH